jgi:hypothetical protein
MLHLASEVVVMRLVSISSYFCHSDYTPLGQRGTCGRHGIEPEE